MKRYEPFYTYVEMTEDDNGEWLKREEVIEELKSYLKQNNTSDYRTLIYDIKLLIEELEK